jgi:hypothetical protein
LLLTSLDQFYAPQEPPWFLRLTVKGGFFALLLLWVTFWLRVQRPLPAFQSVASVPDPVEAKVD